MGATPPSGSAFELWAIAPGAAHPQSLGVIPPDGVLRLDALPPSVRDGATLAISMRAEQDPDVATKFMLMPWFRKHHTCPCGIPPNSAGLLNVSKHFFRSVSLNQGTRARYTGNKEPA
jgi:hypothetical protein